jgi:hypothetical protein
MVQLSVITPSEHVLMKKNPWLPPSHSCCSLRGSFCSRLVGLRRVYGLLHAPPDDDGSGKSDRKPHKEADAGDCCRAHDFAVPSFFSKGVLNQSGAPTR